MLGLIARMDPCTQPVYQYILPVNVTMRSGLGMEVGVRERWLVIHDWDGWLSMIGMQKTLCTQGTTFVGEDGMCFEVCQEGCGGLSVEVMEIIPGDMRKEEVEAIPDDRNGFPCLPYGNHHGLHEKSRD